MELQVISNNTAHTHMRVPLEGLFYQHIHYVGLYENCVTWSPCFMQLAAVG